MNVSFSLVKKIVLGISIVAVVTYGTSAFCIFVLKDLIAPDMNSLLYSIITLALGIFWTGFLGWLTARLLVKPLNALHAAAVKASKGNLSTSVDIPQSKDELMQVSTSFNEMLTSLRSIVIDIDGHSSATSKEVEQMRSAAEQAAGLLTEISERIDTISSNTDIQAKLSHGMYETIEDIARLSENAQSRTSTAKSDADSMQETMASSSQTIGSFFQAMNQFAEEGKETAVIVKKLEQHAVQIGEIINVVEDISARTHLLALNASIEAAHAGEQGRGFEVVAVEIRKLANHSSDEVKNIGGLIESIQSDLATAVRRMELQALNTQAESAKTSAAIDQLHEVSDSVERTVHAVASIAELISEQSLKMKTILSGAERVAHAARDNADTLNGIASSVQEQNAMVQEVAAASNELQSMSTAMRSRIGKFQLH